MREIHRKHYASIKAKPKPFLLNFYCNSEKQSGHERHPTNEASKVRNCFLELILLLGLVHIEVEVDFWNVFSLS